MATDGNGDGVHEQLRAMERGESASWIVYPPTPSWWPVAFGAWAAVFALVVGTLDGVPKSLAELGLVVLMAVAMGWDRRRRGTYPSGKPPRELRPAMLVLVLGAVAVAGVAWWSGERLGVGVAAAVAGVGAYAVDAWYEHEYAAVAARLRERLG
jgi:hypothetical protein